MNGSIRNQAWEISLVFYIVGFFLGAFLGLLSPTVYENDHSTITTFEQWGGALPMNIYTIYDRDTGVYYAVTEKGGICIMETMEGKTKLVDEGEPSVIHRNQGES